MEKSGGEGKIMGDRQRKKGCREARREEKITEVKDRESE